MANEHMKRHSTSLIVQFSSVAQSCPTLCDPMNHSTPGLPVHHQLPEFTQTHVHRVSDVIQPSHPLSSPSPPAPPEGEKKKFSLIILSDHFCLTLGTFLLISLFLDLSWVTISKAPGIVLFC